MERLTGRLYDGTAYVCSETGEEGVGWATTQRRLPELILRLAAYEDTGLEPEGVIHLAEAWQQEHEALCQYYALGPIDHLRKLVQAEKDERLVVLPCKVGQRVFSTLDDIGRVHECEVRQIILGERFNTIVLGPIDYLCGEYGASDRCFGKTVFLTREEAERALENERKRYE